MKKKKTKKEKKKKKQENCNFYKSLNNSKPECDVLYLMGTSVENISSIPRQRT